MKEYDFYIVPTPIGNLGDITLRAIEILKSVDLIACEDSRVTQKILNHFDIRTKCVSYHKYNEKERIEQAITLLSQISRADEEYTFIGFLPRTLPKIEEIAIENKYKDFVFYESPNRILQTLEYIQNVRPNAKVAFGRELTKVFEEVKVGEISEIISHLKLNIVKGEFVCIIFREEKTSEDDDIKEKVKVLQNKGFSAKDISVILSELYGMNKNVVYKISIGK